MKAYEALNVKKRSEWFSKAIESTKNVIDQKLLYEQLLPAVFAFLLSRAVVFNNMAPFGVAFYASSMRGKKDFVPLAACIIGYISIHSQVNVFKYIAILIVIYAISVGFEKKTVRNYKSI